MSASERTLEGSMTLDGRTVQSERILVSRESERSLSEDQEPSSPRTTSESLDAESMAEAMEASINSMALSRPTIAAANRRRPSKVENLAASIPEEHRMNSKDLALDEPATTLKRSQSDALGQNGQTWGDRLDKMERDYQARIVALEGEVSMLRAALVAANIAVPSKVAVAVAATQPVPAVMPVEPTHDKVAPLTNEAPMEAATVPTTIALDTKQKPAIPRRASLEVSTSVGSGVDGNGIPEPPIAPIVVPIVAPSVLPPVPPPPPPAESESPLSSSPPPPPAVEEEEEREEEQHEKHEPKVDDEPAPAPLSNEEDLKKEQHEEHDEEQHNYKKHAADDGHDSEESFGDL